MCVCAYASTRRHPSHWQIQNKTHFLHLSRLFWTEVEQVVKVIWQKDRIATAHGQFSGIHQVASVCTPPKSTTQTASQCLQPFFHNSRQSVVGHARACPFPQKIEDLGHDLIRGSLGPPDSTSQSNLDRLSRFCTANSPYTLQWAALPLKKLSFPWGIWTPCNTWFLGHIRAHNPNGISIGSAVIAGLTIVTDWPTDYDSLLGR